jgi:hypothetical protein
MQGTVLLSSATMAIFKNFPKIFKINKDIFCKNIIKVQNLKTYANKLTLYRNYFKDYFVDTRTVNKITTLRYLKKIQKSQFKIMYLIYCKKKIVGQYGLHMWPNFYITLDGAMRFEKCKYKKLFILIQKKIIHFIRLNILNSKPVIILHKKNKSALMLHEHFNFKNIKDKKKKIFFENYIKKKKNSIKSFYIKELVI